MTKKSVHKLSVPTEGTSSWLGISSHENDYRLSWAINQQLGFNLVKSENHKVFNQKLNEQQEFSVYSYQDDETVSYRLISNRCDNGFLLEKFKNIDFILVISPDQNPEFKANLISRMRTVSFVSAVFLLDIAKSRGI